MKPSFRLSEQEFKLLSSIQFSLTEEVDIFYAYHKNKAVFETTVFDQTSLRERIIGNVEVLENMREG